MNQQIYNTSFRTTLLGMLFCIITLPTAAQDDDGAVVGAQVVNENTPIKDFKVLFNAQLESIENADYLSYSQRIEEDSYLFFVSSRIEYKNKTYTFKITLKENGKIIRTFIKTTDDIEEDDSKEDVSNWMNQVIQNINFYNSVGEGKFMQEILIYKPEIRGHEGSENERSDKRNIIKIQKRLVKLLQNNSDLSNRCIIEKVDSVFTELDDPIESQAYFYCEYKMDEANSGPLSLHLYLDYDEPCYYKAIDFGTKEDPKMEELDKYIETNWVKTFLIERDCDD